MTRAAFDKIAAGLREAIAVARVDDIPARIECYGAFRQPPSRQSPETKKGRPARQPVLPVSSLGSGDIAHVPLKHEQVPLRRNSVPLERKT
ncbi:hypothetical protein RADP37_05453 (plasmid) [Roseomonas mucosa]|uniref:Uncharacterized protein n=1 Tax=Roseomonas mucosa TaxID=207340 RepID=A0A4Y1MQW3_9PROT|nr:hypothetical protein [Roseomonas mucosa]AWV20337.1 hypothetical protein RADP37_05453 [Roseomonas mucosa]